jgi:hypothetical protein
MESNSPLGIVDLTSDAPIMASLRCKVKAAVARYYSPDSGLPPFSVAEMMVMGLPEEGTTRLYRR